MFPRPMPSPAASRCRRRSARACRRQRPSPERPPPVALSPAEAQERFSLREGLRLRRSVDHFARAWYGAIASLILTGVALKLFHDHPGFAWSGALASGLALLGWVFAISFLVRSRRVARAERTMLRRLVDLESRVPRPPELF